MYSVFLAGGIASGKSACAREMERLGAERVDLDELSRVVLAPGHPCAQIIADTFDVPLIEDEGIDRAKLAQIVFQDAQALNTLEEIEHPYIIRELELMLDEPHKGPLVVEVPLLDRIEALFERADEICAVICPKDVRLERACRRGMAAQDVLLRMERQPSDEYLISKADTLFINDGTLEELFEQVQMWWTDHVAHAWESNRAKGELDGS